MAHSSSNLDYGREDYWNERYAQDEEHEWCKEYAILKPLLEEHVKPQDSILILGCGNSQLSIDMYNDGFQNISNIDFSSVVISKMTERYPCMNWKTMDMLNLTYPDATFDVVIEKATLDVLFVDEKSPWVPSEIVSSKMNDVLSGVSRILKKQGHFISITFAQPHFRSRFYKQFWSNCKYSTFGTGFHYYFYTCCNDDDEQEQYRTSKP